MDNILEVRNLSVGFYIEDILKEINEYGTVTYKRMYGKWSFIFCLYFWLLKYKKYKRYVSFTEAYRCIFGGSKECEGEHV